MSCKFRLHVKYECVASRSEKWSQCGSILNLHSSAGPSGAPPLNAEKDQLYVNVNVTGQVKACVNFPQDLTIELNWIDSATNGWQSWQRLQNFSMCRLRLLLHDYSVSRHLLCRQMLSPDFSMYRSSCEVFGVHEINSKCTRGATMTQHLKQEWFYRWSPQTFLPPHLLGLSVWLWLHHNW